MSAVSPGTAWVRAAGLGGAASGLAVVGLMPALLSMPAGATRVAAVFPPWWPPARAFAAASSAGEVAGTGALRSILIVRSEQPALASRLNAAGALLILAADGSFGCRSTTPQDIAR